MISLAIAQSEFPRLFRRRSLALIGFVALLFSYATVDAKPASAQVGTNTAALQEEEKYDDRSYYADAHPYIDEPLTSLSREIRELRKLKPAIDQETLPKILAKTAANVDSFFHDVVDLIAEENITQQRSTSLGSTKARVHDSYLIVRASNGSRSDVAEYRMDAEGKRIDQIVGGYLVTTGFALIGNYFSTASQPESRFRYLGDEKVGSRETYVVAFAQRPGQATQFVTMAGPRGASANLLVQGIAWVDKSNFQIIRLRTDLLAPRPEIGLERQTTEVTFSNVQFQDVANPLWLPSQVKVYLSVKESDSLRSRLSFHNEHRYTDYRRYRVSVKIASPK
jgi:hypothetical protein